MSSGTFAERQKCSLFHSPRGFGLRDISDLKPAARLLQTLLAIATRVALIDVQRRNVPSLLWFFSASAVLRAMTAPGTRSTTQGLHAEVLRFAHGVRADVAVLGRLVQGGAIAQEEVQEEEEQVGVVKMVLGGRLSS